MDAIGKKLKELEELKSKYQEEVELKTSEIEIYYKGQREAIESIQVNESESAKILEGTEAIDQMKEKRIQDIKREYEIELRCVHSQISFLSELASKGYKLIK